MKNEKLRCGTVFRIFLFFKKPTTPSLRDTPPSVKEGTFPRTVLSLKIPSFLEGGVPVGRGGRFFRLLSSFSGCKGSDFLCF
jgi:hypothetical protein